MIKAIIKSFPCFQFFLWFLSFIYLPFVCSIWSTCRFVVSGFRWMLALIDDDGCFGVWSFSVGGLSGLLSFFPCFLPLSCLCFKSLWLLSFCWSVRECWLIVLDLLSYVKDRFVSLWLYVLCVQVPETSVSLVLVVGLCHFWLLFTGHVRHLLLELILIFDFTVQHSRT